LDDIEAQLASSSRGNALVSLAGPHAEELWIRAPIDRQRAVVTELLTATVLPSGRRGKDFDPELVRVEWKGSLR
jgi:site-specific DNA recombinase